MFCLRKNIAYYRMSTAKVMSSCFSLSHIIIWGLRKNLTSYLRNTASLTLFTTLLIWTNTTSRAITRFVRAGSWIIWNWNSLSFYFTSLFQSLFILRLWIILLLLLPKVLLLISKQVCMCLYKIFWNFHRLSLLLFVSSFHSSFLFLYFDHSSESFCTTVLAFFFIFCPCVIRPFIMK